jgi:hypothetical protein
MFLSISNFIILIFTILLSLPVVGSNILVYFCLFHLFSLTFKAEWLPQLCQFLIPSILFFNVLFSLFISCQFLILVNSLFCEFYYVDFLFGQFFSLCLLKFLFLFNFFIFLIPYFINLIFVKFIVSISHIFN